MPDGSKWTGFYSDWTTLSKKDRQTDLDTRKANKFKDGSKKGAWGKNKYKVADLKRCLAALQYQHCGHNDDEGDDNSETPDNVGNSFGEGQRNKQKKE